LVCGVPALKGRDNWGQRVFYVDVSGCVQMLWRKNLSDR